MKKLNEKILFISSFLVYVFAIILFTQLKGYFLIFEYILCVSALSYQIYILLKKMLEKKERRRKAKIIFNVCIGFLFLELMIILSKGIFGYTPPDFVSIKGNMIYGVEAIKTSFISEMIILNVIPIIPICVAYTISFIFYSREIKKSKKNIET